MTKYFRIGIRLTANERDILEKKAKDLGFSLSEYTRFQLLQNTENSHTNKALEWFNKNYEAVIKLLVKGAGTSIANAQLHASEETYQQMQKQIIEKYKEFGLESE